MKAKEKGIDLNNQKRENNSTERRGPGSFNAFRALKEQKNSRGGNDRPRKDKFPAKAEDIPESELVISYEGKDVKITKDGTLAEPDSLPYREGAVLGFDGIGSDRFSHHDVKVNLHSSRRCH